jgi:hypothetical protein
MLTDVICVTSIITAGCKKLLAKYTYMRQISIAILAPYNKPLNFILFVNNFTELYFYF